MSVPPRSSTLRERGRNCGRRGRGRAAPCGSNAGPPGRRASRARRRLPAGRPPPGAAARARRFASPRSPPRRAASRPAERGARGARATRPSPRSSRDEDRDRETTSRSRRRRRPKDGRGSPRRLMRWDCGARPLTPSRAARRRPGEGPPLRRGPTPVAPCRRTGRASSPRARPRRRRRRRARTAAGTRGSSPQRISRSRTDSGGIVGVHPHRRWAGPPRARSRGARSPPGCQSSMLSVPPTAPTPRREPAY